MDNISGFSAERSETISTVVTVTSVTLGRRNV